MWCSGIRTSFHLLGQWLKKQKVTTGWPLLPASAGFAVLQWFNVGGYSSVFNSLSSFEIVVRFLWQTLHNTAPSSCSIFSRRIGFESDTRMLLASLQLSFHSFYRFLLSSEVAKRQRQQIQQFIALTLTVHAQVWLTNMEIVYIAQHAKVLAPTWH